ncbi:MULTISPECIES: hypothetical protein [Corynebacterium]|uniref:Uncharacterized protein n=1 Tax=Corynebacterium kefirresidentii TaxID=1979527 RepID=A0ABT8Q2J5_9CORY|nr:MULTISPECIES: hypothetical protein [Corynebacterium]WKS54776.1 hypothetical protein NLL48_00340 [Corynebacterium tuberculostearicum]MCG7449697.1 hypothetical protein [Corynebacterium kefirresidentii]MCG7451869.1 hypothetical protein [Corynebacterium kefirresidentii]MDK8599285.1 hypothetical protein [Corynebacterium kefirresidentii]MDK8695330.1 hypothetical protein [Corynebacterium kefirresidentii]
MCETARRFQYSASTISKKL